MQTELDKLLSSISPEKVIVATFNRANEAISTFHPKSALIENWDEFKHCMVEFMRHVDNYSLRLRGSVDISSLLLVTMCSCAFESVRLKR